MSNEQTLPYYPNHRLQPTRVKGKPDHVFTSSIATAQDSNVVAVQELKALIRSGACNRRVAQNKMGWEQRGNNQYYYRKEREGSRVKSTYVGRGEIAHMISQFQSSSAELEKLMHAKKSIEADELNRIEGTLDREVELVQLFTDATLLAAGFHTHRRQWRRKRNGAPY